MGLLDTDSPKKKRGLFDSFALSQSSSGDSGASNPTTSSGAGGRNTDPTPTENGFLGKGWDDPKSIANLRLAAGLMSPGSLGQGLGRGLAGYEETLGNAADRTSREKERISLQSAREQQMQMQGLQMQDMQRQAEQQIALQSLAKQYSLAPPSDGIGPQGFDFGGYSDALASIDPVKALSIKAAIQKDSTPIKLAAGEKLLAPGSFQELANNPKVAEDPAAIKEYNLSRLQGYKGTFDQWKKEMAAAGAARTNVSVNTAQNPFFSGLGGFAAKQFEGSMTAAQEAAKRLEANATVGKILASGDVYTGTGAETKLAIGKALQAVGINLDKDAIRNTEVLGTQLAQRTLNSIKSSGLGAGNGFTDKDRQFLQQAVGGTLTINGSTMQKLLELDNRAAKAVIQKHNKLVAPVQKAAPMQGFPMDFTVPEPDIQAPAPSGWSIKRVP